MAYTTVSDGYFIFFAITILFTILALAFRGKGLERMILAVLSFCMWFIMIPVHFATYQPSDALFLSGAVLYFMFGIVFVIYSFYITFSYIADVGKAKKEKENTISELDSP